MLTYADVSSPDTTPRCPADAELEIENILLRSSGSLQPPRKIDRYVIPQVKTQEREKEGEQRQTGRGGEGGREGGREVRICFKMHFARCLANAAEIRLRSLC